MTYRIQSFSGAPEQVAEAMQVWLAQQPLAMRIDGGPVLVQISHETHGVAGLVMTALVLAAVTEEAR